MSPHHQQKAILLIWCIVVLVAFVSFAGNGVGWMRLLPAIILLLAAVAATAILYSAVPAPERAFAQAPTEAWTPRELEVLALISRGYTNDEIADELVIALSTVKTHINNIYRKLGVRNRVQAAARARSLELV